MRKDGHYDRLYYLPDDDKFNIQALKDSDRELIDVLTQIKSSNTDYQALQKSKILSNKSELKDNKQGNNIENEEIKVTEEN